MRTQCNGEGDIIMGFAVRTLSWRGKAVGGEKAWEKAGFAGGNWGRGILTGREMCWWADLRGKVNCVGIVDKELSFKDLLCMGRKEA